MLCNPIKQVGEYHLLKEIGRGATATVYLGTDRRSNQLVAVKVIPTDRLLNPLAAKQFKSEYMLLKRLNNKHIINTIELITSKKNKYLIIDYCNGGTLLDYRIKYEEKYHCEMNEVFIQKLIRQLIIGLEYMHINNVIHRDIKLENIFLHFDDCANKYIKDKPLPKVDFNSVSLNDNFTLKIGDLGLAKVLDNGISSTLCGSPITMSPEVMMNNGTYNTKADLWSLGAVTYELLTGALPFDAHSLEKLKTLIANGTYRLPKELKASIEIISFINGLLQFYPEKRMNWQQIKQHPFIVKTVKDFHFLDLEQVSNDDNKDIDLQLNTKTCDNYLWLLYKTDAVNTPLDKMNLDVDIINTGDTDKQNNTQTNTVEDKDSWIMLDTSDEKECNVEEICTQYQIINDYF